VSTYPDDYLYSREHEWIRVEEDHAVLGITEFAQSELGDVVFVELPEPGDVFDADDEIGTIESVKAVAEIYTPVSGEVVEVNAELQDRPEIVNQDPHERGWLVRLRLWTAGHVYLVRARGIPPPLRRRIFLVYFLGPPGLLYLLRAMASLEVHRSAPFVPFYSFGVWSVFFLVQVFLMPHPDARRSLRPRDRDAGRDGEPPVLP
jgi:glycine cleavage system H protein